MIAREILDRCLALAKGDPALEQDIRALIVWGLGAKQTEDGRSRDNLLWDLDSLKNTVRDLESENRRLRYEAERKRP